MRYKLFMLDVGLLGALSELTATSILEENDIFMEFKGNLTEQYMLQQMISDTPHSSVGCYKKKYMLFSHNNSFHRNRLSNTIPTIIEIQELQKLSSS